MKTISTMEIAKMMKKRHSKILERIKGTKDNKTIGLITILKNQNISVEEYFIESVYKDKSGKCNICYLCTTNGVKMFLDYTRNYRDKKEVLKWYKTNSNNNENIILCDRKEQYFIDELQEVLDAMNIESSRQYNVLQYYIDLFLPKLNIAIEYDEAEHKNYTYENQELRQENIEKEIGCDFIRVNDSNSNLHNIGIVINKLGKRIYT